MSNDPVSPCTGVCTIDQVALTCRGCMRTLDEIACWFEGGPAERRAILAAVAIRKGVADRAGSD